MSFLNAQHRYCKFREFAFPAGVIIVLWGAITAFVDPRGEFMINDDWSFIKIIEVLSEEGHMIATGWGKGGPSAIVHVLWGWLFTSLTGYSVTALRVSVIILGSVCSLGLLVLLFSCGVSRWLALWGVLTLMLNPLFLSQCFTFMTDITFVTLVVFSLLLLNQGIMQENRFLILLGLGFAAACILTRQIGIVVPLGFIAACLIRPERASFGRLRLVLATCAATLLPMTAYELWLWKVGSTPLVKHELISYIAEVPLSEGLWKYLGTLGGRLYRSFLYIGFFVSPLLVLFYPDYWKSRDFRWAVLGFTMILVIVEAGLILGWWDIPVTFHRNVLYNWGIGPIVLADTYIRKISRVPGISPVFFVFFVYWGALAAFALLKNGLSTVTSSMKPSSQCQNAYASSFLSFFSLVSALIYLGIIQLTGFHDRYFIPVFVLAIILVLCKRNCFQDFVFTRNKVIIGLICLVSIGLFSVLGLKDFMSLKRSLESAQDYVVHELQVDPCDFDGGFEFNGYHCYYRGVQSAENASWWWVRKENYLLTLGPLEGYRVVRTFPFVRWMGPDGAVHVLTR